LLPDLAQRTVRELLREYVDVRLAAAESGDVEAAISRSEEIHALLWAQATASVRENPSSIAAGLFVQALNEVIDLHSKRVMVALRSRIPGTIWIALYAVAFLALGTMGYHSGLAGTNRSFAIITVAITFSAVIWLVRDLDTAQEGTLRISQQTMVDLRNSMNAP
jgi:anti-sigma factor RsiW